MVAVTVDYLEAAVRLADHVTRSSTTGVWRGFGSDSLAWLDAKVGNSNTTQIPEQNPFWQNPPG